MHNILPPGSKSGLIKCDELGYGKPVTGFHAVTHSGINIWYMSGPERVNNLFAGPVRARAESLGLDCKVGLMERAERVVLLGLGSAVFGLAWNGLALDLIIIVVAVLTNLTAIQRIVWVYRHGKGVPLE